MSSYTLLAPFKSSDLACKAVEKIFRSGVIPSGLEFMERDAIDWATKDLEKINIPTNKEIEAHLLIEGDGYGDDAVLKEAEKVGFERAYLPKPRKRTNAKLGLELSYAENLSELIDILGGIS